MDANEIINFISTVGFPIVMCVLMFRTMTDTIKANSESITKLCEKIDRLIDKVDNE